MESKAQKAALAKIKEDIDYLISRAKLEPKYSDAEYNKLLDLTRNIKSYIEYYGLEERLFTDAINKTYDTLMESGRYGDAASFAKEYGL